MHIKNKTIPRLELVLANPYAGTNCAPRRGPANSPKDQPIV